MKNSNKEEEVKQLTWATVNLDESQEMARFTEQHLKRAGEHAGEEIRRLQELGIYDSDGRLIDKSIPDEMKSDNGQEGHD